MLSIQSFNNISDHEIKEEQSSLPFENANERYFQYTHSSANQFDRFNMEQSHSPQIVYDWTCNKSSTHPMSNPADSLYLLPPPPCLSSLTECLHLQDQNMYALHWPKQHVIDTRENMYVPIKKEEFPTLPTVDYTRKPYHPRVKSEGGARLSYEHKEVYHQFFSPPLMPSSQLHLDNSSFYNFHEKPLESNLSTETSFLFDIDLHAPTAITKKQDEETVTYLNRGQPYLVHLQAKPFDEFTYQNSTVNSSTLSIAFHEPGHREIAKSYWKYWISQQEMPKEARAIDIDIHQTTGAFNIRLVAFDQIAFDWHSQFGAKVFVRFNCLSTDFSRIKGVKGIPMRLVVETSQSHMTLPNDTYLYKGTFKKIAADLSSYSYTEACYCKIKLFRDKGAERKNKDDKKQMAKQIEKVIATTNGNPEHHPLWQVMNQKSQTVSKLNEVPSSPNITLDDDLDDLEELQQIMSSNEILPPFMKRKRSNPHSYSTQTKHDIVKIPQKKSKYTKSSQLTIYVWNRHTNSSPEPLLLETFTTIHLKSKLSDFLSIPSSRVSEILWHRKKTKDASPNDILVLVEDSFITEHISDGEVMIVDWELKQDGKIRLILEF